MAILQFLIPLDSGERISYGVTVVLSMTVFQMFFVDQLPETSLTTPFVSEYIKWIFIDTSQIMWYDNEERVKNE